MNTFLRRLAIIATFAVSAPLFADEVRLPVGQGYESYSGALPNRGQTKAQIETEFGNPDSTHGPSGEPPIYYWEYSDFTVYFEHDYVIHTVIKKR